MKVELSVSMAISSQFEQKLVTMVKSSMKCRHIAGMTMAIVKGELFVSMAISS